MLTKKQRATIYRKLGETLEAKKKSEHNDLLLKYGSQGFPEGDLFFRSEFNSWANGKTNPTLKERNEVRLLIFYLLEHITLTTE